MANTLISLRDMILARVGFLVTISVFLAGAGFVLFGLLPVAERIAEDRFDSAATRVEAGLAALFLPPARLLDMSRGWLAGEVPDLEKPEAFNRLFQPLLESTSQLTSVVAGSSTGQGWLLLQQADGSWRNRMTDIPRWGERHLIIDRFSDGRTSRYWDKQPYDPRQRPWFQAALAGENKHEVRWTAPYSFFTTGDPGITASTLIRLADGRDFVLGFDLMLRDLSQSTLHASVGKHGLALVVTDDEKLLAMPAAPESVTENEWLRRILQPVSELGLTPVSDAFTAWRSENRKTDGILSFRSGGSRWLSSIRPYALGSQQFWVMTLAPAADFSPPWWPIISALAGALTLALLVALLIARAEASRLARPLESLAKASSQIGQLDFRGAAPVNSRIAEIRQLAVAQETMRALLQNNQRMLADQAEYLHRQIAALLAAEDKIKYLAFYDALTQLPNRRLLQDRLQQALASSERSGRAAALLFIDVDDFKTLNDTRGHDVGDQLLIKMGQRLHTCIRRGDTVARLGGDEFVAMLEDLGEQPQDAAEQAREIGEKILRVLAQPYELGVHEYHSSVSIGIALIAGQQNSIDDLLKRADLAMYQAKAAGRNALRFFDPQMQAVVSARALLESELRQGLQQVEFVLYYQALVDTAGHLTGAEALVRWQHPRRGLVFPADFIPLAEESGLILPLGAWVLETACRQLVAWAAQAATAHLTLAVNVSAHQFRQSDFVQGVLAVITRTGAAPQKLKLELTESLLLDDVEDVITKMAALKSRGIGFSLDDFGTGYSSLAYLKRLPLDQLKIDRSFIKDIETDADDAAICTATIELAHNLGLKVVGEGVETEAQRLFLTTHHACDFMQGYLFGKPLPVAAFDQAIGGFPVS